MRRAREGFSEWQKPVQVMFSDGDPITRGGEALFAGRVPGAARMTHRTLRGGHFIQEDDPVGFVAAIRDVAVAGK